MASSNANSLSLGGSSKNVRARSPEADSDGKNRSPPPPRPKRGPYKCPRCQDVFSTSQESAAHLKSHHKLEKEDKKRRKVEVKRKPYRANLIRAGGEPDDCGDSTHESEEAEIENPSKECTHACENKK